MKCNFFKIKVIFLISKFQLGLHFFLFLKIKTFKPEMKTKQFGLFQVSKRDK